MFKTYCMAGTLQLFAATQTTMNLKSDCIASRITVNLIHEILILYNRYDWLQISHAGYSKDTNLGLVHSGSVMPLSSVVTIYLRWNFS